MVHYFEMSLKMRYLNLRAKIRDIRMLSIIGIAEAGSGHPGASFSAAEIMGSLYFRIMKHDPLNPEWSERDYFINSKAHSAPGYYATLSVAGYFPTDEMALYGSLDHDFRVIQFDIVFIKKSKAYQG